MNVAGNTKGATLVELCVYMVILPIIMGAIWMILSHSVLTHQHVMNSANSMQVTRNAMLAITKEIQNTRSITNPQYKSGLITVLDNGLEYDGNTIKLDTASSKIIITANNGTARTIPAEGIVKITFIRDGTLRDSKNTVNDAENIKRIGISLTVKRENSTVDFTQIATALNL